MDFVYLIPEKLLINLSNHPQLSPIFKNVDHDKYNQMMVLIISELMQDKYSTYDHFNMLHITKEQSKAWMECFSQTLDELNIDDITKLDFSRKMEKALSEMMRPAEICQFISNVVEQSSSPRRLLDHIKRHLQELNNFRGQ